MTVSVVLPKNFREQDWPDFHAFWQAQHDQSRNPRDLQPVEELKRLWTTVHPHVDMSMLAYKQNARFAAAVRFWMEGVASPSYEQKKDMFWAEIHALAPVVNPADLGLLLDGLKNSFHASGKKTFQLMLNDDAVRDPILEFFPFEEVSRSAEYFQDLAQSPAPPAADSRFRFRLLDLDLELDALAELYNEVHKDIPWGTQLIAVKDFGRDYLIERMTFARERFKKEFYAFAAYDGDEMVALHTLYVPIDNPRIIEVDTTGVRRSARGQALASQVKAFAVAQMRALRPSLKFAVTATNETNQAMQKTNASLGYEKRVNYSVLKYRGA